jgi:hypothetical protein
MAETGEMAEMDEALRSVAGHARDLWHRFAEEIELERRMRETPMTVLAAAAGAGFILGGGLWPVLRPIVKGAMRAALSPANLLAIGAAVGAIRFSGGSEEAAAVAGEGGSGAH